MFGRRKPPTPETHPELDLAAGLVHELLTPLAEASVHLDTLKREKLTPKQETALAGVRGALGRVQAALDAVSAIRSLKHGDSIERRQIPIAEATRVVKRVLADLEHQYSDRPIRVVLRVPPAAGRLSADRSQLTVAVREVFKNGYQYSFAGSTMMVEINVRDGNFCIECRSTGIPLDGSDARNCMEPGWRAPAAIASEPGGRGLGLWLAKKVVESHGGKIEIGASGAQTSVALKFPLGVDR